MAEDIITPGPPEGWTPPEGWVPEEIETRSAARVADTDFGQRIITVVAVPYEQPTVVPFRGEAWQELFTRGAFSGFDPSKRRLPVSAAFDVPDKGHSNGKLIGKLIHAYHDREEGMVADVQVAETVLGEETLQLAKDNMLGASVGFGLKSPTDQELNRTTRTRRINRAFLHHLSFVGEPAYEQARVLAMRSSTGHQVGTESSTPLLDEFLEDDFFRTMLKRVQG